MALAILLISICVAVFIIRRFLRQTIKKQAIKTLNLIETSFNESADANTCLSEISVLLRRVTISRNPQDAGLTGPAWLKSLDLLSKSHVAKPEFSEGIGRILLTGPYQAQVGNEDAVQLLQLCRKAVNRL